MSTTLTTTTTEIRRATRTDRQTARRTTAGNPTLGTPALGEPNELLAKRPASELTRLVFCVLLGIAACIALVGVVDQASTTSPDAPAPAVIVDFD